MGTSAAVYEDAANGDYSRADGYRALVSQMGDVVFQGAGI